MSDGEKLNCGSCVHRERFYRRAGALEEEAAVCTCASITPGDEAPRKLIAGPHDCAHWEASDAHRQAEALEGIEFALMVLAGIVPEPEDEEAEADSVQVACDACGTRWDASPSELEMACPGCGKGFVGNGAGVWLDAPADE